MEVPPPPHPHPGSPEIFFKEYMRGLIINFAEFSFC